MGFGKKVKDGGKPTGGGILTWIPKEGELNVRFLDDIDDFVFYEDVYDKEASRSYPKPDSMDMPGYVTKGDKDYQISSKYVANAINLDTDEVILVQIPATVFKALEARYDRKGTILGTDFCCYRTGSGMDTKYFAEVADDQKKIDTSKYDTLDVEAALETIYLAAFPEMANDEDEDEKPARRKSASSSRKSASKTVQSKSRRRPQIVVEDEDEDDDEDIEDEDDDDIEDEDDEDIEDEDDDDDIEDEDDDEDDEDESGEYDEDELMAMTSVELVTLAKDLGVPFKKGMKKSALVQAILEEQEDY